MDIKEMKRFLVRDTRRIETLLGYFSFHSFNYPEHDHMRCALPKADNSSSVLINLDENLYGIVFSRGNFKSDIFGIIAEFANRDIKDVFSVTRVLFNLPGYKSQNTRIDILKDIRMYQNNKKKNKYIENKKYNKNDVLSKYIRLPHASIIEEGIAPKVCKLYELAYDPQSNRMVFPHTDWKDHDSIVGLQARTTIDHDTAKLLGIPKYLNLINGYKKEYNLYGYSVNKEAINENEMIILFEGEKSVLKLATFNYSNPSPCVAVGGHFLSLEQIKFIANNTPFNTEVVFAFDNDVMKDKVEFIQLESMMKKMNMFRKTSYIKDKYNLLSEKDSPVDKGLDVWNYLLSDRITYRERDYE